MDRSWITASQISDKYENGVKEFLQFAKRNGIGVNNKYYCLCVNCVNVIRQDIELIQYGLGMVKFWSNILANLQLNVNILMYILRIAWKT